MINAEYEPLIEISLHESESKLKKKFLLLIFLLFSFFLSLFTYVYTPMIFIFIQFAQLLLELFPLVDVDHRAADPPTSAQVARVDAHISKNIQSIN